MQFKVATIHAVAITTPTGIMWAPVDNNMQPMTRHPFSTFARLRREASKRGRVGLVYYSPDYLPYSLS